MRCPDCNRTFVVLEQKLAGKVLYKTVRVEPPFCPFCLAFFKKMTAAPLNIDSLKIKDDLDDGHPENV